MIIQIMFSKLFYVSQATLVLLVNKFNKQSVLQLFSGSIFQTNWSSRCYSSRTSFSTSVKRWVSAPVILSFSS